MKTFRIIVGILPFSFLQLNLHHWKIVTLNEGRNITTLTNCVLNNKESDSYGNVVVPGVRFLKGHFLEKLYDQKNHVLFKKSPKITFFYRETVLYPFVPFVETKRGYKLMNADLADILDFVEKNNYQTY